MKGQLPGQFLPGCPARVSWPPRKSPAQTFANIWISSAQPPAQRLFTPRPLGRGELVAIKAGVKAGAGGSLRGDCVDDPSARGLNARVLRRSRPAVSPDRGAIPEPRSEAGEGSKQALVTRVRAQCARAGGRLPIFLEATFLQFSEYRATLSGKICLPPSMSTPSQESTSAYFPSP